MARNIQLKKHIINYAKTKEIYTTYKESGYSTKYYTENATNILIHQSVKQAFGLLSKEQIPTIKTLQNKYQECLSKKNSLVADYKSAKSTMKQSVIIKNNVDLIVGASNSKDRSTEHAL